MGGLINTATQETYPTVSPDGKYLFFTRYTNEKSSMDVYWVSAKIIDRLRKNSMKK
jgi:Tol biopolymer transport system component